MIGYKHSQAGTIYNHQPDTDTNTRSDTNNIDYSNNNPPLDDFGRDVNHYLKKIHIHKSLFCKPSKTKTPVATVVAKASIDSSTSNDASDESHSTDSFDSKKCLVDHTSHTKVVSSTSSDPDPQMSCLNSISIDTCSHATSVSAQLMLDREVKLLVASAEASTVMGGAKKRNEESKEPEKDAQRVKKDNGKMKPSPSPPPRDKKDKDGRGRGQDKEKEKSERRSKDSEDEKAKNDKKKEKKENEKKEKKTKEAKEKKEKKAKSSSEDAMSTDGSESGSKMSPATLAERRSAATKAFNPGGPSGPSLSSSSKAGGGTAESVGASDAGVSAAAKAVAPDPNATKMSSTGDDTKRRKTAEAEEAVEALIAAGRAMELVPAEPLPPAMTPPLGPPPLTPKDGADNEGKRQLEAEKRQLELEKEMAGYWKKEEEKGTWNDPPDVRRIGLYGTRRDRPGESSEVKGGKGKQGKNEGGKEDKEDKEAKGEEDGVKGNAGKGILAAKAPTTPTTPPDARATAANPSVQLQDMGKNNSAQFRIVHGLMANHTETMKQHKDLLEPFKTAEVNEENLSNLITVQQQINEDIMMKMKTSLQAQEFGCHEQTALLKHSAIAEGEIAARKREATSNRLQQFKADNWKSAKQMNIYGFSRNSSLAERKKFLEKDLLEPAGLSWDAFESLSFLDSNGGLTTQIQTSLSHPGLRHKLMNFHQPQAAPGAKRPPHSLWLGQARISLRAQLSHEEKIRGTYLKALSNAMAEFSPDWKDGAFIRFSTNEAFWKPQKSGDKAELWGSLDFDWDAMTCTVSYDITAFPPHTTETRVDEIYFQELAKLAAGEGKGDEKGGKGGKSGAKGEERGDNQNWWKEDKDKKSSDWSNDWKADWKAGKQSWKGEGKGSDGSGSGGGGKSSGSGKQQWQSSSKGKGKGKAPAERSWMQSFRVSEIHPWLPFEVHTQSCRNIQQDEASMARKKAAVKSQKRIEEFKAFS